MKYDIISFNMHMCAFFFWFIWGSIFCYKEIKLWELWLDMILLLAFPTNSICSMHPNITYSKVIFKEFHNRYVSNKGVCILWFSSCLPLIIKFYSFFLSFICGVVSRWTSLKAYLLINKILPSCWCCEKKNPDHRIPYQ